MPWPAGWSAGGLSGGRSDLGHSDGQAAEVRRATARASGPEVPGNSIVITRRLCLPPRPSTLCAASWSVAASPPPGSGEGVKHWKHWNGDQLKYGDSGMLKKNALLAVALSALVVAAPMSRSEERRGGKECVSTCRSRGST